MERSILTFNEFLAIYTLNRKHEKRRGYAIVLNSLITLSIESKPRATSLIHFHLSAYPPNTLYEDKVRVLFGETE